MEVSGPEGGDGGFREVEEMLGHQGEGMLTAHRLSVPWAAAACLPQALGLNPAAGLRVCVPADI